MRFSNRQEFLKLHAAYREAWMQFSSQTSSLHLCEADDSANWMAVQALREEVRQSEDRYRGARNCLVNYMLSHLSYASGSESQSALARLKASRSTLLAAGC